MLRTGLISAAVHLLLRARNGHRAAVLLVLSGVLSGASTTVPAAEGQAARNARPAVDRYADFITEATERFDIPSAWIRKVMRTESDGDARATSPKGAMGLMQIMPQTWAELRIHYGLGDDPYDPHDNIMAGAAYLRELFDRYGNPGFLAAYNAGPGRHEASRKGRALSPETRAYVDKLVPEIARDEAEPSALKWAAPPAVETPSWAQAPLFAVQPFRALAADPAPHDRAQPTPDVRDVSAIAPRAEGLFVALGGSGGVQ
ncbi:lytic transglycosylase domain-containing protein [Xanthobacter dioxanivorans]|uniref:Lytic transglycosylase domain-containing protein n=1 Tax=Xanthobacter dioxanivorans TaxID=2528964 RepID=A0A974PP35_9HYPH|nr:lytic transglycosylase domain-containing protein [Xanthobacter dioxanivorans]QRG07152.1 lytic transglycosylase domain-containing protein [Xanthobacter dioxanivorans]